MAQHKGSENLIPLTKRTKEEQRELRVKAGIASGVKRRKNKLIKDIIKAGGEILIENSRTGESKTVAEITFGIELWNKARKGDVKAMEIILKMLGQMPVTNVDITTNGNSVCPIQVEVIDNRDKVEKNEDSDNDNIQ